MAIKFRLANGEEDRAEKLKNAMNQLSGSKEEIEERKIAERKRANDLFNNQILPVKSNYDKNNNRLLPTNNFGNLNLQNTSSNQLPMNNNQDKFLQFKEFEKKDQNPLLSIAKTVTGTGADLLQDVSKGLISPIENVADVGANALASVQDVLGFKNEAKDVRNFANRDLSGTISKRFAQSSIPGVGYNIFNGTPERIINPAGIEIDPNKNFGENVGNIFNTIYNNDDTSKIEDYEKSSILGEYPDKLSELIGYTAGLSLYGGALGNIGKTAEVAEKGSKAKDLINLGTKSLGVDANLGNIGVNIAGHTLNIPTLAVAGGMAGGLQEANSKENVNEWERWGKALSGGLIEGVTEGLFGLMGVGGNDITDKFASKLAGKFSSSAGKMLSKLGVQASGEAAEEFLSYVGNYFVDNGLINKLGDADFSNKWDWKELGEQMALAFVSAGLSGGSTTVLGNNVATKSAEQQLGRPLTMQERAQITQAVIDENVNERLQKLAKEQNQQNLPTQNKNVAPNQTQNEQNQVQQQTTLPMQKMAQNQMSEQLPVSYKNQAENEIKNAKISENDKKMMLDVLNNMQEVNQNDLQDIKIQINQMAQITNETKPAKSFEDVVDEAMDNVEDVKIPSPLENRNINTIGQQTKVNAYQYDNPEVKPYYKEMAQMLSEDLINISSKENRSTVKGGGTKLTTTISAIKTLHNEMGYSYNDIQKGLNNIIEDHGAENNALSKKIEIIIDNQLRNGYRNSYGRLVNPNADYINLINKGQTPINTQNTLPMKEQVSEQVSKQVKAPMQNENYSIDNQKQTTRSTAEKYADRFESRTVMDKVVSQLEKFAEIRNKYNKGHLDILFDDTVNGNGVIVIDGDNRTIRLNPNSKRALEFTLIHELSHDLKGTKGYSNLVDLVKEYNDGNISYPEAFNDIKNMYEDYYKKNNLNLKDLDIDEEAINDVLGTALGTQEFVNRIVQQDRNFAQKIYDWVKRQINIYKSDNRELTRWLYKVQDNFENALRQQNKLEDGIKNHISENLKNDIDRIISGQEENNKLVKIREYPPKELIKYGLEQIPMVMYETHISNNILTKDEGISKGYKADRDWHGLGKDNFIKAIDQLDNPTAIYRWKDNGNTKYNSDNFIILTEIYGNFEGKDSRIIVPFTIEKINNNYRVKSIYGKKEVFKYLNKNIKEGNLENVYTKNRSIENFEKGQSLVKENNTSIKNSITSFDTNVNTSNNTDNQGRALSKQQQEFFKDSKARNDKGELETVYHGTNKAGFTEFNRDFNFFTNNKQMAQSYTRGNEMVDTRRLESISDAKSWLKGITDEAYIENNSVYDEYGEQLLSYNSEEDLLRNLKRDIQKEIGDIDAGGTYEGYVNIENPVIVDAKGDKWSMIPVDGVVIAGIDDINKFLNDYGSSTWKEKGKLRTSTNDIVIAVMDAVEDGRINADGVIIKNVYDEGGYGSIIPNEMGTDYITFNSNQFKAVDNNKPTSNADIRYSISDNQNERISKLNEDWDLTDRTREELYDQRDDLQKQYNELTQSQEYIDAYKRLVKMTDMSKVKNSQEYEYVKKAQDLKNKINDIQDEIDIATSEMRRLSEAIDKEEKQHRSPEDAIKQAKKTLGLTNNFKETGYMLQDGSLLDFSGRSQGSNAYNQRTMDHREINQFGYDMNEFIDLGNIRMQPESNGFELMKEPTEQQYNKLKDYINKANGEVFIDIYKNSRMGTYDTADYKAGTSADKVISDLRYYFKNGKFPYKSSLADFRYSQTKEGNWNNYLEKLDNDLSRNDKRTKTYYTEKSNKVPMPTKTTTTKVALPTSENQKFRKHYKSVIESNYTTDEAKKISKQLMNSDTYVPESNTKQLERADTRIEQAGADSELNSLLSRAMTGGNIKADDIAVGERLIQYYSKTGNKAKLQEAIQATAMAGTTAGQTVQAMSLLNHQTPEGQAVWLQRSVEKMNNDLKKRRGQNAEQFNLTPEMTEKIVNSNNAEELQKNLNEVYDELGQQVSKSTIEKIDAWRYFSMLANPKTHIRNIVGNIAMGKVQGVKNKIAGVIEGAVAKVNPNIERTHTLKRASKEVKQFAKNDINNVADRLELNDNKYNPKTRLENSMRTFKHDAFENTLGKLFEFNNKALEIEDAWGLKSAYVKSLSEYMTANNLTPENITDKQLAKARNYAIEQAKEATFHQASAIATAVNQFSNKNKLTKFVTDAILPFKKTPMNVAKAGFEYSPVGLTKSAIYDTVQLRKGNITINQYIDNISKGLTGTGITLLGYALAEAGILKASGGDDKDKEEYDQDRGKQTYSIQIGDNTYSLDWLAPTGIPLFIGAEIHEIMQQQKEEKSTSSDDDKTYNQAIKSATSILDAFTNAMNPMTEMSMLSGLTSALKSYDGDNAKMLANLGVNATKSYVNQFVPTALGQVAKTTDEYERSTTSTKTGTLPKAIDSTKNYAMSKIPGLRQMLPTKTDIWGKDQKQSENIVQRGLENAVFPWTRKEIKNDDVDKAISKLYEETGENSVLPDSINKNLTINKEKYVMTSDEYAKYKKQYGDTAYKLIDNLVNTKEYKNMTNEQKQTAIENIYKYATEQIKIDYAKNNKLEYTSSTLSNVVNKLNKSDQDDYFEFTAKTKDMSKDIEKLQTLASSNYSNNVKEIIYENSIGKNDNLYNTMKLAGTNIDEYLKYKTQEFTSDKEDDGTTTGKSVSGSKKAKVVDYVQNMNITNDQKLLLLATQYSLTSSEKSRVANYVKGLNTTKANKLKIYESLSGFTVYKDGRVTW